VEFLSAVTRSRGDVVVSATLLAPIVIAVKDFMHDEYESVTAIVVNEVSRTTAGMLAWFTASQGPPVKSLFTVFMAKPVEGVMPTAPKSYPYPEEPMAVMPRVSAESRKVMPSAPMLMILDTDSRNVAFHDASIGTLKGAQAAPICWSPFVSVMSLPVATAEPAKFQPKKPLTASS
jgi:hypothetical protein